MEFVKSSPTSLNKIYIIYFMLKMSQKNFFNFIQIKYITKTQFYIVINSSIPLVLKVSLILVLSESDAKPLSLNTTRVTSESF